jgi:hypothetical protein
LGSLGSRRRWITRPQRFPAVWQFLVRENDARLERMQVGGRAGLGRSNAANLARQCALENVAAEIQNAGSADLDPARI